MPRFVVHVACRRQWQYANLAVCDKLEEQACHGGAEQLDNPVEGPSEDGDVAADHEAEGDGGVQVVAGDVGSHGNTDEEGDRMGVGDPHKAIRVRRGTLRQLPCTQDEFSGT